MIRVFVSYSKSEAVTFSFWKHFFQICGIWVTEKALKGDEIEFSNEPHLFILGNEDIGCVKEQLINQHVYIVKDNAKYKSLLNKKRPDIFSIKRWDEKMPFAKVITALFNGKQATAIRELLEIYIETNLWEISWLFHEFAIEEKSLFDINILQGCTQALEKLNKISKSELAWNYYYMKLYCLYIECKTKDRSLLGRMNNCQKLLAKCLALSEREGWNPILAILRAKIGEMSPTENKAAVNYYIFSLNYEMKANILYDIGYLFENIYGNNELAFQYYQRAYKCDKSYCRAAYKIAFFGEKNGEWMEALKTYYRIKQELNENEKWPITSLQEIDCYYRCCNRIVRIYQSNICDNETINDINKEMLAKTINNKSLDKLLHCMVDKNDFLVKRKMIWEEINKRYNN